MSLSLSRSLLLCGLLLAASADAVVHRNGDGLGNTTPPLDDPGFASVGFTPNGMSGVYLGNRWVLTAAHVGEASFEFAGVVYPPVVGSRIRLEKEGVAVDLAMVKLAGPGPPLPDVVLTSAPPAAGDNVTLVGNGWSRATTPTCWASGWVEVACPGGSYEGYERDGLRTMRWGVNVLTLAAVDVPTGGKLTRSVAMAFDAAGEEDEAQLVKGDSGGAAFLKRNGQWELVAVPFASIVYGGQPKNTAVFGNTSYAADVHHYRGEIESILLEAHPVPAIPLPLAALLGGVLLASARRVATRA